MYRYYRLRKANIRVPRPTIPAGESLDNEEPPAFISEIKQAVDCSTGTDSSMGIVIRDLNAIAYASDTYAEENGEPTVTAITRALRSELARPLGGNKLSREEVLAAKKKCEYSVSEKGNNVVL